MFSLSFLTETAGGTGTDAASTGMGSWSWLLFLIPVGIMVYMMWSGSKKQKKQDQEIREMRNSLMVCDGITTIGGIIGKIVSLKEETMVIETTRDHTRIRLLRSAVRSVDVPAKAKSAQPVQADEPVEVVEQESTEQENN